MSAPRVVVRDFPVPAAQAERAAAYRTAAPVAGARPSATVVLVRDPPGGGTGTGVEIFLLHRETTMAFAAGMHVFPGGGVDERDADAAVPWHGPPPAWWARALGAGEGPGGERAARALVAAAVRETFEECGVLLAGRPGEGVVDVTAAGWEERRRALVARDVAVAELLAAEGLVLRADLLRPWAHWTTPAYEPRRYDTRFLLAALPPGQEARHVGGEASASGWHAAAAAVQACRRGEVLAMPPTLVTLEEVAAAPDVATLLATRRTVRPVLPQAVRTPDGRVVIRAELPEQGP